MKEEMIGKTVQARCKNTSFNGTIIDETKNMLCLKTNNGNKWIIKNSAEIKINDKIIKGNMISKRPEDRIKLC